MHTHPVAEPHVDARGGLVEVAAAESDEADGELARRSGTDPQAVDRESAGAAIDPDGAVPVHEDVGHGRIAGERGQRAEDAPRDAARGPVGARNEGFHPMTLARG